MGGWVGGREGGREGVSEGGREGGGESEGGQAGSWPSAPESSFDQLMMIMTQTKAVLMI